MEIVEAANNKALVFFYEALGTGFLVYAINLQAGGYFGQFGIAFMLFALLLIGGPITGAHYNPAVTVGVYTSNRHWKEDIPMFILMISAQVIGAIFGTYLVWMSLFNQAASNETRGGVPYSEVAFLLPTMPYVTVWNTFFIEMICTFVFVLINLLVKTGKTSPTEDGFLSCLAVALTLLAMLTISGGKTGACLNPAVGIAQTLFEIIQFGDGIPFANFHPSNFSYYLWLYTVAPVTGALLAGLAHRGHLKAYDRIATKTGKLTF